MVNAVLVLLSFDEFDGVSPNSGTTPQQKSSDIQMHTHLTVFGVDMTYLIKQPLSLRRNKGVIERGETVGLVLLYQTMFLFCSRKCVLLCFPCQWWTSIRRWLVEPIEYTFHHRLVAAQ